MGFNKVLLLGNLGSDPELRYTPSQTPVCNFRMATTEKRKNQEGEWVDFTEWHNVVVWGKSAENCNQYLSKGRQAFVEGRIQTEKWQDQSGNDRYTTKIIASSVQFIGGKSDTSMIEKSYVADPNNDQTESIQSNTSGTKSAKPKSVETVSFDDDDIPF